MRTNIKQLILLATSFLHQQAPTSPSPSTTAITPDVLIPQPPGPYTLGCQTRELIDRSRLDTLGPSPHDRIVVFSIFYPSGLAPAENSEPPRFTSPYLHPLTAELWDKGWGEVLGLTEKTFGRVSTPCHTEGPWLDGKWPVILLSTGYGVPRMMYTVLAQALASQGYAVVAMDHTYDAMVVELSNGTLMYKNGDDSPEYMDLLAESRIKDALFVIDHLGNIATYHVDKRAMFGHASGGTTTARVMLEDSRILAGATLDGVIGDTNKTMVIDRPFLIIRNDNGSVDEPKDGPAWDEFWNIFKDWRRDIVVKGAKHMTYTDYPLVLDLLDVRKDLPEEYEKDLGPIDGKRVLDIQSAYLTAYFDFVLKGKTSTLWDGYSSQYPEVDIVR